MPILAASMLFGKLCGLLRSHHDARHFILQENDPAFVSKLLSSSSHVSKAMRFVGGCLSPEAGYPLEGLIESDKLLVPAGAYGDVIVGIVADISERNTTSLSSAARNRSCYFPTGQDCGSDDPSSPLGRFAFWARTGELLVYARLSGGSYIDTLVSSLPSNASPGRSGSPNLRSPGRLRAAVQMWCLSPAVKVGSGDAAQCHVQAIVDDEHFCRRIGRESIVLALLVESAVRQPCMQCALGLPVFTQESLEPANRLSAECKCYAPSYLPTGALSSLGGLQGLWKGSCNVVSYASSPPAFLNRNSFFGVRISLHPVSAEACRQAIFDSSSQYDSLTLAIRYDGRRDAPEPVFQQRNFDYLRQSSPAVGVRPSLDMPLGLMQRTTPTFYRELSSNEARFLGQAPQLYKQAPRLHSYPSPSRDSQSVLGTFDGSDTVAQTYEATGFEKMRRNDPVHPYSLGNYATHIPVPSGSHCLEAKTDIRQDASICHRPSYVPEVHWPSHGKEEQARVQSSDAETAPPGNRNNPPPCGMTYIPPPSTSPSRSLLGSVDTVQDSGVMSTPRGNSEVSKADVAKAMAFTKEQRRRRNRESAARSYLVRKQRNETLLEALRVGRERAAYLFSVQESLRNENEYLRMRLSSSTQAGWIP